MKQNKKSKNEEVFMIKGKKINKWIKVFKINEVSTKAQQIYFQNLLIISNTSPHTINYAEVSSLSENYMKVECESYSFDLEENLSIGMTIDNMELLQYICDSVEVYFTYHIVNGNLKTSNLCLEDEKMIINDSFLDIIRKREDLRLYDICFMSPEQLNCRELNEKSIMWSTGCILYEILYKKIPFKEDDNILNTIYNIQKGKYKTDINDDSFMLNLTNRLLVVDDEERISLKELKKEIITHKIYYLDEEHRLLSGFNNIEMLLNYDIELLSLYSKQYYLNLDNYNGMDVNNILFE